MTHRVILAPVFGDTADAATLDVGVAVARRFQGHLAVLFVRIDPRMPSRSLARACRRRSSIS